MSGTDRAEERDMCWISGGRCITFDEGPLCQPSVGRVVSVNCCLGGRREELFWMSVIGGDQSLDDAGGVTDPSPEVSERAKRRSHTARWGAIVVPLPRVATGVPSLTRSRPRQPHEPVRQGRERCLLYTSDAADDLT